MPRLALRVAGRGPGELISRISVAAARRRSARFWRTPATKRPRKVGALVFVGDAMEENVDRLMRLAGELALAGVKAFMFQEGGPAAGARSGKSRV